MITNIKMEKGLDQYQFSFKGSIYECIGEDRHFNFSNLQYAISVGDWETLQNRITNQLMWYPECLKVVK